MKCIVIESKTIDIILSKQEQYISATTQIIVDLLNFTVDKFSLHNRSVNVSSSNRCVYRGEGNRIHFTQNGRYD